MPEQPKLRERLQWWWYVNEGTAKRVAAAIAAAVALAALLWRDSDQVLEFARVLAWPLVVLTGILILRDPIVRLLRSARLSELRWRDSSLVFDQQQTEAESLPVPAPQTTDEIEKLRLGANVAGALLQAFQLQVDFMKALLRAPEGLSREAAEHWFQDQIERRDHIDPEAFAVRPLLDLVESRGPGSGHILAVR